jgi:hypothetical protein
MTREIAERLITENPEAAKRFYDNEFFEWSRTLKEIKNFDSKKQLNPFYNLAYDIKKDCIEQSNKAKAEIYNQYSEGAKKRMKVFKENPELIKARLKLKEDYLESWPDYDKFVRWSGLKISEEQFNQINVKGDFAKTLKNLYKYLK